MKKKPLRLRYSSSKPPPVGAKCIFDCNEEDRALRKPFINGKRCTVVKHRYRTKYVVYVRFPPVQKVYPVHPAFLLSRELNK